MTTNPKCCWNEEKEDWYENESISPNKVRCLGCFKTLDPNDYCDGCGELLDDEDFHSVYEDRGEFWGAPCSERITTGYKCHSCGHIEDY